MRQLDIFGNVIEVPDEVMATDGLQKRLQQQKPVVRINAISQRQIPTETAPAQVKGQHIIKPEEKEGQKAPAHPTHGANRSVSDEFLDAKIRAAKARIKQQLQQEAMAAKGKVYDPDKPPQKRGRKSLKEQPAEGDAIEIPDDEALFQKQYYPIGEVAKWFKVNQSLLRFWENEFDVLKPRKTRKGSRLFRPEDVKSLQLIHHLVREKKYTLEGAKEHLKTNRHRVETQLVLTQTLQKFKGFLLELKANLHA